MSKRKAFVTGGTGFVGVNVIMELIKQDWDVVALHRASSDLTYIKDLGIELVEGSIRDVTSVMNAMPEGIDTVFHIAGNTNQWKAKNAEQTLDNVDGTRHIVDAAVAKKVRRLIVTSSIAAYGLVEGEIDENTKSNADTSWINYQKSKYLGELEAKKGIERGLEVISINPAVIMGAYDFGTWSRMFLMMRDDQLPGCPPANTSYTHVEEVAKAHVAAADKGEVGSNYLLGGTNAPMSDMMNIMAELLNKPAPKVLPGFVFRMVSFFQGIKASITGVEPQMTPETVYMLTKDVSTQSKKAQSELGYQCRPLREMVEDCYNWMVKEGRI
jgi:dihydroflavonol-4-reductase